MLPETTVNVQAIYRCTRAVYWYIILGEGGGQKVGHEELLQGRRKIKQA